MVTKEELKNEIDKLPANLLSEVYSYLLEKTKKKTQSKSHLAIRDFNGKFDSLEVRKSAYE